MKIPFFALAKNGIAIYPNGHTAIHAHWGWRTSSDKVFRHASHSFHLWWYT